MFHHEMNRLTKLLLLSAAALSSGACPGRAGEDLRLLDQTQTDSEGVFLSQVVENSARVSLPRVRLGNAPAFGQALVLSRAQIVEQAEKTAPEFVSALWTGADRVRVTRRARSLPETEIKDRLTSLLERDYTRDKGDLELRLTRAWTPVMIPDEAYTLKILDLPTTGVSLNFIVRFELSTARETVGTWQVPLQAKIYREIWVAHSALKRGELFAEADLVQERRDVLGLRDPLLATAPSDRMAELSENVLAGAPLYARSLRLRPLVYRGQVVEAQVIDGAMSISLKVEVLENGSAGQSVRVRNPQSKREFRGKVQNEQTILVNL